MKTGHRGAILETLEILDPVERQRGILLYYNALHRAWGPQHWWPGRSRFEVIVGAYLTQNTSWTNVELALQNLRKEKLLSVDGIRQTSLRRLQALIRPAGYFRQKARSLKTFIAFLDGDYGGSLSRMFAQRTEKLREELLTLKGVGPETADSILLYAGQHPVFVVDAYARRILDRHGILSARADYEGIRELLEHALLTAGEAIQLGTEKTKPDAGFVGHRPSRMSRARRSPVAQAYNEMHGFLVAVGKKHCLKSEPKCEGCPLQRFLP